MLSQKGVELVFLLKGEVFWVHSQEVKDAALVSDFWVDLTGEVHEVVGDDADDVEAICDDFGVWEIASDDASVGEAQINADEFDLVAALELGEEGFQGSPAFTGDDVEDLVVFEVAKGGGKALFFMKGVFVNAEDLRALKRDPLGGFASVEMLVDALDGGGSDFGDPGQSGGANAFMMETGGAFTERLRNLFTRLDAR